MDEHMGLNNVVNEGMDMIINSLHLNKIGETVDTTSWRGQTNMELVSNTFELPQHLVPLQWRDYTYS